MNQVHQKLLDAIVEKAKKVCPDSLALIGVYGSCATGDLHEKSDLDLMILIEDEQGYQLANGFLLEDAGIGYDIYCTRWEMLEGDARCDHAQLSRLLDSQLVYVNHPAALQRLEELRRCATETLASGAGREKARNCFRNAKQIYADCFLTDSLSRIRKLSGGVIDSLLGAVMLFHGEYFHRGLKRNFEELARLNLPFDPEELTLAVIRGESPLKIREALTRLMKAVQQLLDQPAQKEAPCRENLAGTYEEMFSNWRNKMPEAAERKDLYASFMNMVSLQFMLDEIAEGVSIRELDVLGTFDPRDLEKNAEAFDDILRQYLEEYRNAGMEPKCFSDADAFRAAYLQE